MKVPAEALQRFEECMAAAIDAGEPEHEAMSLATSDGKGAVSARMVLLKGYDENGFVFYTNILSGKGRQLKACPRAASPLAESGTRVLV